MTTFMTWGTSSGKKGRCDARCHNAKGKKCKCACGGLMHGAHQGKSEAEFQEYTTKIQTFVFEGVRKKIDAGEITSFKCAEHQLKILF